MIEKLTEKQIKKVYKEHFVKYFPKTELKPLSMIMKAVRKGNYDCYGWNENGEAIAFAFLEKCGNDLLIDYFATDEKRRGEGIGSRLLTELKEAVRGADSLMLEVEDPAFAGSEDEKRIRERRLSFYLRCGFAVTGVTAVTFTEPYLILLAEDGKTRGSEEIASLYKAHYKAMLPEKLFRLAVKVNGEN